MGTYGILLPCDGSEPMPISVGDYMDLRSKVGGTFDAVKFEFGPREMEILGAPDGASGFTAVGYVHDEGRLLNLKINTMASIMFGQELVGPVIVVSGTSPSGEYDGENYDVPAWFADNVFDGSLLEVARILEEEANAQSRAMLLAFRDGLFTEAQFEQVLDWMNDPTDHIDELEMAIQIAMTYAAARSVGAIKKFDRDEYERWIEEEFAVTDEEIASFFDEEADNN